MTVDDFRAGFQANLTADYAQYLIASTLEHSALTDPIERAGIVSALHDAFPDLEEWMAEPAAGFLLDLSEEPLIAGPQETPDWNTYYARRFSISGSLADLRELVRRAKHRDGSTASIQTSSAALSLLSEAADGHPEIAVALASAGLDLAAIQFGVFPAGAPATAAAAPRGALGTGAIGSRASAPVAFPPVPASAAPAAAAAPSGWSPRVVVADPFAGTVEVGGVPLSVTAALAMLDDLTRATRRLLLPAEGTAWVNDRIDPLKLSELVMLDPYLAAGLPLFAAGGAILAEVLQSPEDGVYRGKLYDRSGGSSQFGEWHDMNQAKCSIAERVRPELQKLLSPPQQG